MQRAKSGLSDTRIVAILFTSILATALILLLVVLQMPPLQQLHTVSALAVIVLAVSIEMRRNCQIPLLLRPGVIAVSGACGASFAAYTLPRTDYENYLILWITQILGLAFGLVLTFARPGNVPRRVISQSRLRDVSTLLLLASVLAGLIFFLLQGVPALGTDIEQGRVDAAEEGTGYFRLLAYMAIPAAHVAFAIKLRHSWLFILAATALTLGMANRSPLVYLIVPLLVIALAQGRIRIKSRGIIIVAVIVAAVVASIGAFRVVSQAEFASYEEYRTDLYNDDYLQVGLTSFEHYAGVVTENAVLTKNMVDSGDIDTQWGETYLTLFISAIPGEQLSLDRTIKEISGKDFVGGGIPPTQMGEGYVNFGFMGVFGSAFVSVLMLQWACTRLNSSLKDRVSSSRGILGALYGFAVCWIVLSQVAGFAGASTVPLAAALCLLAMYLYGTRQSIPRRAPEMTVLSD